MRLTDAFPAALPPTAARCRYSLSLQYVLITASHFLCEDISFASHLSQLIFSNFLNYFHRLQKLFTFITFKRLHFLT